MKNQVTYGPHLFPGGPEAYIRVSDSNIENSHNSIKQTLKSAFSSENQTNIISKLPSFGQFDLNSPVKLSFLNYGDTQLVYLATIGQTSKVVALINQPHTPLGVVKKEFDNLTRLAEIDLRFVVKPHVYFNLEEKGHELYISEYVNNAMCIAVLNGHGIYDPLPSYHFEKFTPEISSRVNSSMIALLVNYYDIKRKRGIAKTQISGNDFILTRDFQKLNPETVLPNMKIIAARDFIDVSLYEYVDILEQEFLLGTSRSDKEVISGKIIINHSSKSPMTINEIKKGISLGLELRKYH